MSGSLLIHLSVRLSSRLHWHFELIHLFFFLISSLHLSCSCVDKSSYFLHLHLSHNSLVSSYRSLFQEDLLLVNFKETPSIELFFHLALHLQACLFSIVVQHRLTYHILREIHFLLLSSALLSVPLGQLRCPFG